MIKDDRLLVPAEVGDKHSSSSDSPDQPKLREIMQPHDDAQEVLRRSMQHASKQLEMVIQHEERLHVLMVEMKQAQERLTALEGSSSTTCLKVGEHEKQLASMWAIVGRLQEHYTHKKRELDEEDRTSSTRASSKARSEAAGSKY